MKKHPVRHRVRKHKRNGKIVESFMRGSGKSRPSRVVGKTVRRKGLMDSTVIDPNVLKMVLAKMDSLYKTDSYQKFVKKLDKDVADPKIRALLLGGLVDGQLGDDKISTKDIVNRIDALKPTQGEIDLEKSLMFIGKNPKNIPLILSGGKLGSQHFGNNHIVTSSGKHIIDGHHRWSQVYLINPKAELESIDLNIKDPEKALRISQLAIGGISGDIPLKKVSDSKNMYKMSIKDIRKTIPRYLDNSFYEEFHKVDPKRYPDKKSVQEHIVKNVLNLRKNSKPALNISRGLMPQTDKVGAGTFEKALNKGSINIKKPYIKK